MKKLLTLFLSLSFLLCLVACQDQQEVKLENKETTVQQATTASESKSGQESAPAPTEKETEAESDQGKVSRDGVDYYAKYAIEDLGDSIRFKDSLDNELTVQKHPQNVALLYNSYLDLWKLCGGDVAAIAEPADEKPVEGVENAEILGTPSKPNQERLIQMNPDFCVLAPFSSNQELVSQLNEMGIPTLYFECKSKQDYYRLVRIYTALLEDESMFEKYALDIEADIQKILAKVPEGEGPRILMLMATTKAVKVHHLNNQTGEMLLDLGAVNIAKEGMEGEAASDYSMEEIVKEDPDVIFVTEMGSDREAIAKQRRENIEDDPVWSGLTAVKEGRYHVLPKELFTYKPNQNYVEAYQILAQFLYPDVDFSLDK